RPAPASLVEIIQETARALEYPLKQQGFALGIACEEGLPEVRVDRDGLQQALMNLLTNAMKYSGDSREIGLKLLKQGTWAVIQVLDHGVGIGEAEQSRIFDKFYRVASPENDRLPGTGLGLSLVSHFAKAHQGRVPRFPFRQGPSGTRGGREFPRPGQHVFPLSSTGEGAMKRILVIEDDPAILRGLKDNLEYEHYEVLTAADGELGYSLVRETKPDLIILDLMLPKMSGYDLCRKVRSEGILAPILMLTARTEEADRVRGLDLGADDYLTKPFSLPELLARVRAVFRRLQRSQTGNLPDALRLADLSIDFRRFEAQKAGRRLEMSRKEFGVLRLLAARAGEVVTRDELLDEVWGYDRFPTTRTVDNHIALLRSKIEANPAEPRFLLTVRGVGYRLVTVDKS
ncbi:MAG: DNA-binding response regulator, partial [Candidatus Aminicenantes bacterium]|nr:DNA-binding response regulator [Candidatus Aminicenantes bacterium]